MKARAIPMVRPIRAAALVLAILAMATVPALAKGGHGGGHGGGGHYRGGHAGGGHGGEPCWRSPHGWRPPAVAAGRSGEGRSRGAMAGYRGMRAGWRLDVPSIHGDAAALAGRSSTGMRPGAGANRGGNMANTGRNN